MKPGPLLLIILLLSSPLYALGSLRPQTDVTGAMVLQAMPQKKLTLIDKIRLLKKIKGKSSWKQSRGITPKQKRQARWSLVLGLISFAFLFMPFAMFIAFPAAIGGLIFGIKSVDGNSNAQGIIGIVASSVAMSIFLIVGIVWLSIALTGL